MTSAKPHFALRIGGVNIGTDHATKPGRVTYWIGASVENTNSSAPSIAKDWSLDVKFADGRFYRAVFIHTSGVLTWTNPLELEGVMGDTGRRSSPQQDRKQRGPGDRAWKSAFRFAARNKGQRRRSGHAIDAIGEGPLRRPVFGESNASGDRGVPLRPSRRDRRP